MASKKFYAVVKGKVPGIYSTWDECKAQTQGFSGAIFKSFSSEKEAVDYLHSFDSSNEYEKYAALGQTELIDVSAANPAVVLAFTDGSYSENTGYSSGAILFFNGRCEVWNEKGTDEEAASIRNIAGEIAAARYAVDYAIYNGAEKVVIFYDYAGVESWATGLWEAKNPFTQRYSEYMNEIKQLVEIKFCKIAGHTGVPMNEYADALAKEALKYDE